ncbi:DUF3558 domain-containing protein [Streptomyces sp. NPDC091292]|uniref:DUF3558 domain-containing protein n=1 Tax=Streptomyces sp. NPDC091292 TaxID=3365991 RepID=UPI0038173074
MQRPAKRLTRILVCAAAVPVLLAASGCSSDSGSGDSGAKKDSGASASSSGGSDGGADGTPTVEKAAFAKLPDPCGALAKKTLGDLVPKAKSGSAGRSDDTSMRGTCSWNSLENKGVDGSQFRWLNVSLLRFESDAARGSGAKLAGEYQAKQVKDAQATDGAANVKTSALSTGDAAQLVRYDLKKKEGSFKQQTVVARVENVVVTVDYNGAGLAGDKAPSADTLAKAAQKAAQEAVNAVIAANSASNGSPSPSKSPKAAS